ncbi:3-keto-5-aminohexanoate cleavage protein [Oryzobacter telluris]|uniref:3-keto-5-aminohexanoate cleavage protein n=1 Tax=Oryzobacter telluris TaxID=3149179 RepID=UPI00370D3419
MSALLAQLNRPVPIVLAPTGMVPTKAMTPHVPVTPEEIARDVAEAAAIGITSVHIHARDDEGVPTWTRDTYERIVGAVRDAAPEVLVNVSTSGRTWTELERRADCLALDGDLKPDLASLTLSSLNFISGASVNAPETVRGLAQIMLDRGITPELEIFDMGMVNVVNVLRKQGLLPGAIVANLFFGNVSGLQATPSEIGLTVDRLPDDAVWSGAGLGAFALPAQAIALAAGGGVRVGLEDGIHLDRGRTTLATNPGLVERIHGLIDTLDRRVMTSGELRGILDGTATW